MSYLSHNTPLVGVFEITPELDELKGERFKNSTITDRARATNESKGKSALRPGSHTFGLKPKIFRYSSPLAEARGNQLERARPASDARAPVGSQLLTQSGLSGKSPVCLFQTRMNGPDEKPNPARFARLRRRCL